MARQYQKRYNIRGKNTRSANWEVLHFVGRTMEKTAVGVARWATTDHLGFSQKFMNMPTMGFLDTIRCAITIFLIQLLGIVIYSVLMGLLIAFGIPFLITALLAA